MSKYTETLTKLREATGPSRELDAALALVEEKLPGWHINVSSSRNEKSVSLWEYDGQAARRYWCNSAPTLCLAILTALFEALEGEAK